MPYYKTSFEELVITLFKQRVERAEPMDDDICYISRSYTGVRCVYQTESAGEAVLCHLQHTDPMLWRDYAVHIMADTIGLDDEARTRVEDTEEADFLCLREMDEKDVDQFIYFLIEAYTGEELEEQNEFDWLERVKLIKPSA